MQKKGIAEQAKASKKQKRYYKWWVGDGDGGSMETLEAGLKTFSVTCTQINNKPFFGLIDP